MENSNWAKWARTLQQKNLTGFALGLIEGAGPLKVLLSQLMQGCAPLINQTNSDSWQSFARMLEDPAECRSFASYLREENDLERN